MYIVKTSDIHSAITVTQHITYAFDVLNVEHITDTDSLVTTTYNKFVVSQFTDKFGDVWSKVYQVVK